MKIAKTAKRIAAALLLLGALAALPAADYTYTSSTATLNVSVPVAVCPGGAVIVRLSAKSANSSDVTVDGVKTSLKRNGAEKNTASANGYKLKDAGASFMALLPLDSMVKTGEYTLSLSCSVNGAPFALTYPVAVAPKEFVSETIYLNETNTAIKTDTSTKRYQQIDRLNDILFATHYDALYLEGAFVFPVSSTRRTSFYGDRRVYEYNTGKSSTSLHYGIDFGVPTGTDVRACGKGKVVLVEDRVSTGWSIVIEHLPGLYSLYYHLSRADVAVGDVVGAGQHIALSGATGLATGPHLHWEVRLLGVAISPDFLVETDMLN